jgi:hypothetical protein
MDNLGRQVLEAQFRGVVAQAFNEGRHVSRLP